MKNYIVFILAMFLVLPPSLLAQEVSIEHEQSKRNYQSAKQEIENMLNGRQPLSYEKAIFLIENAWWENQMDYTAFEKIISRDTSIIRMVISQSEPKQEKIDEHNIFAALKEYNNQKKGYLKTALINAAIFSYLTDTLYFVDSNSLQRHLPFSYAKGDPFGSNNWGNTQVLSLLGTGKGNCFALVSLFKIFSERFNSDASICTAPGHVYISHKDDKGIRYNVEIASKVFPGTGTLSTLTHTTHDAIVNDISLRELNLKQSVALSLIYLAKGYEHKFSPLQNDSFMVSCANLVLKHDSLNLNAMLLKAELWEKQLISTNKPVSKLQGDPTFVSYQKLIKKLCSLGYREMPIAMKNQLIKGWMNDTLTKLANQIAQAAPNSTGMTATRYASLSWGLFEEQITTKATERYGNTLFNTKNKKIIGFAKEQNIYNNYEFDPVVFAWSVDPMAHKYPHASPYNFVENNPISRVDPDGADWILATGKNIYWFGGNIGDKQNLMATFKMSSGVVIENSLSVARNGGKPVDYRNSKFQGNSNEGPTPEGHYYVNLKPDFKREAQSQSAKPRTGAEATLKRNPEGGVEQIPYMIWMLGDKSTNIGWDAQIGWGTERAHLEPVSVTGANSKNRDINSFYLHNSTKGFSHGCVECETGVFDMMQKYKDAGNGRIDVIIDYPTNNSSTYGGTDKPQQITPTQNNQNQGQH